MKPTRFMVVAGMILAAASSRLIPHAPNFTPVAALALFGGACFRDKRAAFLVPLFGLFLSDLILGFYRITPVVYGSVAMITCLGFWLRKKQTISRTAVASLASAFLFFIVTNLGVWALDGLYPKSIAGLSECYVAGIPFFRNTLVSDLLYSAVLFGSLLLAEKQWPILSERAATPVHS